MFLLCKVPAEGRFKHSRWSGLASVLPVKKGCYSLSHSCRHQALDRSLNLQHCQLTAVMAHHNLRDCSLRLESLHIGQRGLRMCSLFWQLRLRKESKCKLATSCPKGSAAKWRRNLSAAQLGFPSLPNSFRLNLRDTCLPLYHSRRVTV